MRKSIRAFAALSALVLAACTASSADASSTTTAAQTNVRAAATVSSEQQLAQDILGDTALDTVLTKARALVSQPLQGAAATTYPQVWIRDLNTFLPIYLSSGGDRQVARDTLVKLLGLAGNDGNIPDGYEIATGAPFKNSVEADQETSLVLAFNTYLTVTGDWDLLKADVGGKNVANRLEDAMQYLYLNRTDWGYGLLWNGATVDWGDVEAGNSVGVDLNSESHPALGIYTNALYVMALNAMATWPNVHTEWWVDRGAWTETNIRRHLWNWTKYRAHVYLKGSPFPSSFDESRVTVHGGTAVAMQAGLMTDNEIRRQVPLMDADVAAAGANSVGLTVYPPYPAVSWTCSGCTDMRPWQYQNGGDWDWFGARLVSAMVNVDPATAYRWLKPMVARVVKTGDFYEWWDRSGNGQGSPGMKGAAGTMGTAILALQAWAEAHKG